MIIASSPTITLIASTTLPRASEVTWPRLVRSPCAISVAMSRNRVMLRWSSSRLWRSSSRSVSVWTSDRSRTTVRSEEHTSELQSRQYLVCRLLLEKKKTTQLFLTQTAGIRRVVASALVEHELGAHHQGRTKTAHVPRDLTDRIMSQVGTITVLEYC